MNAPTNQSKTEFYAPRFEVRLEGKKFTQIADVLSVKVTSDIANLTSFDIAVNTDVRTIEEREQGKKVSVRRLPYVDPGALEDGLTFDVGKRIAISMGYGKRMGPMMTGFITSMTPRFPESGPLSVSVAGQDDMILLKGRKPGDGEKVRWAPDVYDWQIAQDIAARNGLDVEVDQAGPQHDEVIQKKDQDDATFLMERAKRIDFDCYIRTNLDTLKSTLYFKLPRDKRDSKPTQVYHFVWGESLINFSPRITVANQVAEVTVRGWDYNNKKPIVATATAADLPGNNKGISGPDGVARALGRKNGMVVDMPVRSQEEAAEHAKALLAEKAYDFITGSARCIGLPELRPGDVVDLVGLGDRFSGEYYVTKTDHSISSSGFFTQFDVRRMRDEGT